MTAIEFDILRTKRGGWKEGSNEIKDGRRKGRGMGGRECCFDAMACP